MKKRILYLSLSLIFSPVVYASALPDLPTFDQASIEQKEEIKKLRSQLHIISEKPRNHIGQKTPGGWVLSENPSIDIDKGGVNITVKKNGKVSSVHYPTKKVERKLITAATLNNAKSNLLSLLLTESLVYMYGEWQDFKIYGDPNPGFFTKLWYFFRIQDFDNLARFEMHFYKPTNEDAKYHWILHSDYDYVINNTVYGSLGAAGSAGCSFLAYYHEDSPYGTSYRWEKLDGSLTLHCIEPDTYIPQTGRYTYSETSFHAIRKTEQFVKLNKLANTVARSFNPKAPTPAPMSNLVGSIAVADVLFGDYDKDFERNAKKDPKPLELPPTPKVSPYKVDYPEFLPKPEPDDNPAPSAPDASPNTPKNPVNNPDVPSAPDASPGSAPTNNPGSAPIHSPSSNPSGSPSPGTNPHQQPRPGTNPNSEPAPNPRPNPETSPSPSPRPGAPNSIPSVPILPGSNPISNPIVRPIVNPSKPEVSPFELPLFCNWASAVCDFFKWYKEKPNEDKKEREGDDDNVSYKESKLDREAFDRDYVRYGGSCPNFNSFRVSFAGKSASIKIDMRPICDLAKMVRPAILALAYFIALGIVAKALRDA